jgi:hypothetical protein
MFGRTHTTENARRLDDIRIVSRETIEDLRSMNSGDIALEKLLIVW